VQPMSATKFPHQPTGRKSSTPEPVLAQLHHEWQHISIRSDQLRAVRRWGLPGEPVGSLDEVLVRAGFSVGVRRGGISALPASTPGHANDAHLRGTDEYLLCLVRLARHDTLAARIVLQRILPPLCAVARRHSNGHGQRQDLLDDLVANAWPIIRNYPIDRRPQRVASNLVRDITFETIVRPARRRSAGEVPTQHEFLVDTDDRPTTEPLDELVGLLRDARGVPGIFEGDIAFICQLINHGRPENLAITLDVTARTIRNRRDAVVHRLRALVACAA
jgi:hypothetical protein